MLLMFILGIVLRLNVNKKIKSKTENNGKHFDTMVSLKYLSYFWKTFEMPLINCETNLILTYSESCVLSDTNMYQATKFTITDTKIYVPKSQIMFNSRWRKATGTIEITIYCTIYAQLIGININQK